MRIGYGCQHIDELLNPPGASIRLPGRLNSEKDGISILNNNSLITFGSTPTESVATTGPEGIVGQILSGLQIINGSPTIASSNRMTGPAGSGLWNLSGATTNASTILHELVHALAYMGWAGGELVNKEELWPNVSRANTALVDDNCSKYFIK